MAIKKYIPIDSVDDIDLSKISIANINDRYIDKKGNRFATRFNLRTKKIQIIRIALGEEEAKKARGKIVQGLVNRKIKSSSKQPSDVEKTEDIEPPDLTDLDVGKEDLTEKSVSAKTKSAKKPIPQWIIDENIQPVEIFNPGDFLATLDENYKLLSERLFGIINNIKNSGVLKETAEIDEAIDFTNIFDHTIEPKMTECKKYRDEMNKYAERPEHYFTMIEKVYRAYVRDLPEHETMEFLKSYFVGGLCLDVLAETLKFIQTVADKTGHIDQDTMDGDKRQFLAYGHSTCDFLRGYVKEDAAKILRWMIDEKVFDWD